MIVAHHAVEGLLPALAAAATTAPLLLVAVRARLGGLRRHRGSIRRRRRARMNGT